MQSAKKHVPAASSCVTVPALRAMNRLFRRLPGLTFSAFLLLTGSGALAAPSIGDFNPKLGSAGTVVTITGTGFTGASTVIFGDSNGQTTALTVVNPTRIDVIVPLTAVSGSIAVVTPTGTASSGLRFFEAGPRITFFSPPTGAPGTSVRVDGANFTLGSTPRVNAVRFNGVPAAQGQVIGATTLNALVPPGGTSGFIEIETPAGLARSGAKFYAQPIIQRITPTNGIAGDTITLHGTSFDDATSVRIGNTEAPFVVVQSTNAVLVLGTNVTSGRITLTAPGGAFIHPTNLVIGPRIVAFSPASGRSGTNVTLAGAAFNGVQEVRFGGVLAAFTPGTVNQLTATVPAGAFTAPISIKTTNGTYVTDASFYITPALTSFTPSSGVGGAEVTLNGSNFTGATNVTFNGVAAAFTLVSSNRVTATVPATATTGFIEVSTPGGVARSASAFNVLPVVAGFEPVSAARGAAIEILGSGLTGVQSVTFAEGASAGFTALTPNRLRAVVPATAFSGPVTVRTAAGTAISPGPFFVTGATPSISSFSPTTGAPGTDVAIRGAGVRSAQAVDFNGAPAAFRLEQGTNLVATVPVGATTGPITVTTVDGAATSATPFTVPLDVVALGVTLVPPNVVLRWPTNAPGYTLEFTLQLVSGAVWNPVPLPPSVVDEDFVVSLPATGAGGYFRLRK